MLHIAPEKQLRHALEASQNIDYITADLLSPDVAVTMDVTDIPFEDGSFDVIICNHVLEHVQDDRKALAELYRTLRPGGWALLQSALWADLERTREDPTIITPDGRREHFGQDDHFRIYGQDYAERLSEAGFHVTVDDYVRRLDPGLVRRYALQFDEDIYFCVRSA
jgi:SAM-dependent methyltransferase